MTVYARAFRSAAWMGAVYAVATGILIFFFGKYMTALFVSHNVGRIMEYVDIYLKCVGISFIPLAVVNLYRNGIQGMGYGLLPMTAGIAELIGEAGRPLQPPILAVMQASAWQARLPGSWLERF